MGAALLQRLPGDKSFHPVVFFSSKLNQAQYNYSATGAKAKYLMAKISNLSHCRLALHCSCSGDYAVASVQRHVSNILHAALHRGPEQHTQSHTTYHPYEPLTSTNMHHGSY